MDTTAEKNDTEEQRLVEPHHQDQDDRRFKNNQHIVWATPEEDQD